jgi:hypothetical protein
VILLRFRREADWGTWTQVEINDSEERERDEADMANIIVSGCIRAGICFIEQWTGEAWEDYYSA